MPRKRQQRSDDDGDEQYSTSNQRRDRRADERKKARRTSVGDQDVGSNQPSTSTSTEADPTILPDPVPVPGGRTPRHLNTPHRSTSESSTVELDESATHITHQGKNVRGRSHLALSQPSTSAATTEAQGLMNRMELQDAGRRGRRLAHSTSPIASSSATHGNPTVATARGRTPRSNIKSKVDSAIMQNIVAATGGRTPRALNKCTPRKRNEESSADESDENLSLQRSPNRTRLKRVRHRSQSEDEANQPSTSASTPQRPVAAPRGRTPRVFIESRLHRRKEECSRQQGTNQSNLDIGDQGPSTSTTQAVMRRNPGRTSRATRSLLTDSDLSDEAGDDCDDAADDSDYVAPLPRSERRRSDYPNRISGQEHRARALRELLTSDSDECDDIQNPEILMGDKICQLGDKDNRFDIRCPYCGALHFKTIFKRDSPYYKDPKDLICCDGGKVFIPPMRKRPVEIDELNNDRKTKAMLVSYNTCFSFASIQYNKMPSAPFGQPVAKTMGPIRHFPSAAIPNDPSRPQFGNLYLYMGDEAVQLRMQNFSYLNKQVVKKLQNVLQQCHPFANTLRTMGSIINDVQKKGEADDLVRLKIVDARMVPKSWLQGHQGLYRDPLQLGESVALFYSATVEQDVKLPGLMIYPRKGRNTPMPIFPWDPRINTFCYPLFFPFGEYGHKYGGFKLAEDPTEWYENRLLDWAKENPAIAKVWDLNWTLEEFMERVHAPESTSDILRYRTGGDPNIEIISDLSDGDEDDNVYDQLRHDLESYDVNGSDERREVVERGGQLYPRHSVEGPHSDDEQDNDDTMADYDGGEQFRGIAQSAISTSSSGTAPVGRTPQASTSHNATLSSGTSPVGRTPQATQSHIIDPSGDVEGEDLTADEQRLEYIDAIEQEDIPIEPVSIAHRSHRERDEEPDEYSDYSDGGSNTNVSDIPDQNWVRQLELDESEVAEVQHRKYATLRQWALYSYQQRKTCGDDTTCVKNRFTSSGKLGQVFLLDLATRMYQMRHSFQRKHHTEYMRTSKTKFLNALQRRADRHNKTIGCVSTVPHTVAGSPRHLQNLFEHTVAMSRSRNAKPDLFITATCNVNWPEIQNNLPPGELWVDHPMVVNKVFKQKFEKLLDMIVGKRIEKGRAIRAKGLFGRVRWFSYSIEFQQRGPPHAHLVVSLKNHIKTAEQIDRVCQAVLPEYDGTPESIEMRQLVEDFMIHRPCERDEEAYCRQNIGSNKKECRKHFPKPFSDVTKFGDSNYPELRRPNNGEHCANNPEADNRYVVPYNTQLLSFFRAHVNVEVVSNLSVVKYIFKYVFKGYDRVLIEAITSMSAPDTAAMTIEGHLIYPKSIKIPPGARKQRELEARKRLRDNDIPMTDANGQKVLVYDEFAIVEDQRALTGCEAAWDFQSFPRHGQSHTVVDLFVHGEEDEPITYKADEQETKEREVLQNQDIRTRFKEWFKLNQRDEEARSLTYEELPKHYVFKNHCWRRKDKKKTFLFGRIKSVHPRNKEVFAIRLLATKQKGPQSFEDLRTVSGVLHSTFVSAAMELGLMNNQMEWDKCLDEASAKRVPVTMRRLFASILVFNFVKNPVELWEKYKKFFYERRPTWSDEQKEAHALYHIDSFLRAHLTSLGEFKLPGIDSNELPVKDSLVDDSGMFDISPLEAGIEYQKYATGLNPDQARVFDRITSSIGDPDHVKPIFVQGSGGVGKTRLFSAVFYALIKNGCKVASVAHTGVAARLLPYGSTAHRLFHIPLAVEEDMHCNVDYESVEADRLGQLDVVIWDEATMTDRRILQAVDRLMKLLHPGHDCLPFGGVKFIFGGDWKQTLPVVPETRGAGVVNFTMRGSELWKDVEVLELTQNMRARFDRPFSTWLDGIGNGLHNIGRNDGITREEDQMIKLQHGTIVDSEMDLLTAVFGDLSAPLDATRDRFESSAILAVDNKTTFDINEKALKRMPGEVRTFLSVDEHHQGTDFNYLDPEVYHGETPSGMPPHELNVKVGCPVMLLLNINTSLGLVNGTRMIVDEIQEHIIWARPVNQENSGTPNKRTPERWPLTRMHFSPIRVFRMERCFQRTQFPIRLAFSTTINKSQGQTLDRVGILLRTPCFSHGQLYVALSRVRQSSNLFIYNYHGVWQNHFEKRIEREIVLEEDNWRKEQRVKRDKAEERKTTRTKLRRHASTPAAVDSEVEPDAIIDAVVVYKGAANKDERHYTNNVVYASALNYR